MPEAEFGLAALTSDGCLVHCDLKKKKFVCRICIVTGREKID